MSKKSKQTSLLSICSLGGENDIVVAFDRRHTYDWARLKARIVAWESRLNAHPGQYFAISVPQVFEFTAILLAAMRCQKVLCLCPHTHREGLLQMREIVDGFIGDFDPQYQALQPPPLSDRVTTSFPSVKMDLTLPVIMLLTSGSTGQPKVLVKTLLQLADEMTMLENQWAWAQSDVAIVSTVSHLHLYGFIFRCLWPLCAARPFCADNITFIEDLVHYIAGPTVLVTSPAHLKRLADNALPWDNLQQKIRCIVSSGASLSDEAVQGVQAQLKLAVTEIYGSSETGALATRCRPALNHYWQALPGVSLRIQAQTQQLEVNAQHVAPDWVRCDDLASLSREGLTLLGRTDDIVKLEGKRTSLLQLNQVLESSPLIAEARCALVQSKRDSVGAIVVLSEQGLIHYREQGKKALRDCLQKQLAGRVEAHAIPRRWRYLMHMPVNTQGKLRKDLLQQILMPAEDQILPVELDGLVTAQHVVLRVFIPDTLRYLKGHFPQWAVVPGVAQLEWIVHYIKQYFDADFTFTRLEAIKFTRPIEANTALVITLQYEQSKQQTGYTIASLAGEHASGRIIGGRHAV